MLSRIDQAIQWLVDDIVWVRDSWKRAAKSELNIFFYALEDRACKLSALIGQILYEHLIDIILLLLFWLYEQTPELYLYLLDLFLPNY